MTRTPCQDVVVVGAGIIGAAVALELARRGASVTVIERGAVGEEASAAAAGMLSPQAEADGPSPFLELGLACRARYAEWVRAASEESGVRVDYRAGGVLNLALTAEDAAKLQARRDWQRPLGLETEWLGGDEARELEPVLAEDLPGALFLPREAWVDSAALTQALAIAARRRGAQVVERTSVTGLAVTGGRVTGVTAGERRYDAGHVVIAAGAWASRIGGLPIPGDWVTPCRGQILAVRLAKPRIGHVLYTHGSYAVPRGADELLVGTTVEQTGFDRQVTAGGIRSIVAGVARFAPAIEGAEVLRLAAGLRPESRDGVPVIGPLARLPGLVLAAGHFRNGILLAPLTGELVAEAIVSGGTPAALGPFLPDRLPGGPGEPSHPPGRRC